MAKKSGDWFGAYIAQNAMATGLAPGLAEAYREACEKRDGQPWKYTIGDSHPAYGRVEAMGFRDGERYYMFIDRHGVVSLIPAETVS